jgi:hypothetical protein
MFVFPAGDDGTAENENELEEIGAYVPCWKA